jgi:hypothetical protein
MEISVILSDADCNLLIGRAVYTALKIRRVADGYLLDWSDLTFKAAAWVTPATPLIEMDPTNLPGRYKKDVTVTGWNDGFYQADIQFDDGITAHIFSGEQYIQGGREIERNLDVAISTRAAPGAVMGKSPATLAAADVTGNLPAEVVNWKGVAAPAMTGDAFAAVGALHNATQGATKGELDAAQGAIEGAITAIPLSALLLAIQGADGPTLLELQSAVTAAQEAIQADIAILPYGPSYILQGLAVTMSPNLLTVNLDGVATKLTLKQGEAKTLILTVRDSTGGPVDLSTATLTLGVKKTKSDTDYALTKTDTDFEMANAALGIVTVDLTESQTNLEGGVYVGELKCSWTEGTIINKSVDLDILIEPAVIPVTVTP